MQYNSSMPTYFPLSLPAHNGEETQRIEMHVYEEMRCLLELLQYGQELCRKGQFSAEKLCQEIKCLTQEQAQLHLHCPEHIETTAVPARAQIAIPVQFGKRLYGTLSIMDNASEHGALALPFPFVRLLAQLCGWLLYTLEQAAFIRGRCRRLTYQINGPLTKREHEVLAFICQGYDVQMIADELCISPTTVGKHKQHIYEQLGVHNEQDACLVAYQTGLFCFFDDRKIE